MVQEEPGSVTCGTGVKVKEGFSGKKQQEKLAKPKGRLPRGLVQRHRKAAGWEGNTSRQLENSRAIPGEKRKEPVFFRVLGPTGGGTNTKRGGWANKNRNELLDTFEKGRSLGGRRGKKHLPLMTTRLGL